MLKLTGVARTNHRRDRDLASYREMAASRRRMAAGSRRPGPLSITTARRPILSEESCSSSVSKLSAILPRCRKVRQPRFAASARSRAPAPSSQRGQHDPARDEGHERPADRRRAGIWLILGTGSMDDLHD